MEAKKRKLLSFEGLIAAPFTSYDSQGNVNLDTVSQFAEYLSEKGVTGAFVNGTTGDSVCLNLKERKIITEKWISDGRKWLEIIIVHVGATSMEETKELARHAEQHNADAIAVLPPLYYRPNNDDELITYLGEVSRSAPSTPLMLYHIPSMSGVNLNLSTFVEKAQQKVPNFCGAKYTSCDLKDLVHTQAKHKDSFKLMLGSDELALAALPYGVNAFVGITYNMLGPVSSRVLDAFKTGNLQQALKEQNALIEILEKISKHGSLFQVMRAAMNSKTPIHVGNHRLPQCPLSKDSLNDLLNVLDTCNFN